MNSWNSNDRIVASGLRVSLNGCLFILSQTKTYDYVRLNCYNIYCIEVNIIYFEINMYFKYEIEKSYV